MQNGFQLSRTLAIRIFAVSVFVSLLLLAWDASLRAALQLVNQRPGNRSVLLRVTCLLFAGGLLSRPTESNQPVTEDDRIRPGGNDYEGE